jgi:hypothetical protein
LAFRNFSSLSCHFWPFTGVLRKILRFVTRKVWKPPRLNRGSWTVEAERPRITRLRLWSYGGQGTDVTDQI